MHKTRYNSLRLRLEIAPRGPLLIKAGGMTANPSLPDMQFVRTYRAGEGESLYIPGSSLKGVVRSFAERALRTIDDRRSWRWACATFQGKKHEEKNCAQQLDKDSSSWEVYRASCGACRLFGHTRLRGRLAFSDLLPSRSIPTEVRYGVAISRQTQAARGGALFEMETAVGGTFEGQVILENYELWQLGLLALSLQALNSRVLKIGFGKNRGFGDVAARVLEAEVDEIQPAGTQDGLRGLAAFVNEEVQHKYGLASTTTLTGIATPARAEDLGFYLRRVFDGEGWETIAAAAIAALHEERGDG